MTSAASFSGTCSQITFNFRFLGPFRCFLSHGSSLDVFDLCSHAVRQKFARPARRVTGRHLELVIVDQAYVGKDAAAAAKRGNHLPVVKLAETKRSFVILSRHFSIPR